MMMCVDIEYTMLFQYLPKMSLTEKAHKVTLLCWYGPKDQLLKKMSTIKTLALVKHVEIPQFCWQLSKNARPVSIIHIQSSLLYVAFLNFVNMVCGVSICIG